MARSITRSGFHWHVLIVQGCRWVFGLLLGLLCCSRYVWCLFLALVCGGYWAFGPWFWVVRRVGSSGQGRLAGSG